MVGIIPMQTVGMAKYMKNRVPGMDVPNEVVKHMGGAPKKNKPRKASESPSS